MPEVISIPVKVRSYKLTRRGLRGLSISLPSAWTQDLRLQPGDSIEVFRTTDDQLILKATRLERVGS